MPTYSLGTPPIDALNLNSIISILSQLPDNTSKQITPKDVRDAIYTTWENIIIKPVGLSGSSYGYIGLDSTENGLTHSKFYLGKRQFSGSDIMNNNLLINDSDFFFFNNKSDSGSQNTKISILSGTNSLLYLTAPYIEAETIMYGLTSSYIDLIIKNKSTVDNIYGGNINIESDYGYVSINGMTFPKYIVPGGPSSSIIDGYVLKYNSSGYLTWEDANTNNDTIYSTGTVSITGNPVLINGQETNFLTDSTPTPLTVGGILAGTTFSNDSVVDILRRILYPYIPPTVSIELIAIGDGYNNTGSSIIAEVGNIGTFSYNYDISKKTNDISSAISANLSPTPTTPITSSTISNILMLSSIADIGTYGSLTFSLTVGDGTEYNTSTSELNKVYPYFYGATTSIISPIGFNSAFAGKLTKNIKDKSDSTIALSGANSCVYFAYPIIHGILSSIIDSNGFDITQAFTYSTVSLSSPGGWWGSINYYLYTYTSGTPSTSATYSSWGIPPLYTSSSNYQFKY